ncbi:MAG: FAD-binding oxidoreductase [Candidatus Binatia bacterium]
MTATEAFRIQLEGSDRAYDCAGDDTILRAGLRAGLGLSYECNVGSCGSCKYQLIAGEVDVHWKEAPGLSARDWERGRRLACQSRPTSDCRIKMVVNDEFAPHTRPKRFAATLAEVVDVTHDMRELRFRTDGPASFLPGQYALLSVPGANAPRAYSMSNVGNEAGAWEFVIRRVRNGYVTGYLFDQVAVGGTVEMDGPFGLAYLRPDAPRDLVCIAGGSGLSPMISIARGFVRDDRLAGRKLHFFYGARGPLDVCGETHLCELPGFGERIVYHPAISMPELDPEGQWQGARGFIHELVPSILGEPLPSYEFYMAGPPPMIEATQKLLAATHKVPFQQVHYDRFF